MPIAVVCPSCDAKLKAPDALVGKSVKCPKCTTSILIKAPAQAAAAKAAPKAAPKRPVVEDIDDDVDDAPPPPRAKAKPKKPAEDDDFGGLDDIADEPPRKGKAKAKARDDEDDIEDEEDDRPKKKGKGKGADVPSSPTNEEDRKWAMFLYLSSLIPGIGALGPIVIWFMKKKESKFVDWHFKAWVNYGITMFLMLMLLGVALGALGAGLYFVNEWLAFVPLGLLGLILAVLSLMNLIFFIKAVLAAKAGVWYQFPMAKRFWK